jgi:hypothetical protein
MNRVSATIRRLGPAGARDNALRACEEHRLAILRVDALGKRLALMATHPTAATSAGSGERRRSA